MRTWRDSQQVGCDPCGEQERRELGGGDAAGFVYRQNSICRVTKSRERKSEVPQEEIGRGQCWQSDVVREQDRSVVRLDHSMDGKIDAIGVLDVLAARRENLGPSHAFERLLI